MYFKNIIDVELSTKDKESRKSLHQILVRFGYHRNKDEKSKFNTEIDKLA